MNIFAFLTAEEFINDVYIIDVSGINEIFNIDICYGAKDNFFYIFIGQDLYHSYWKNLALLQYHIYSGNV